MREPLLRAPPFPGIAPETAAVSRVAAVPAADAPDPTALFAAIRAARVGGPFWAPTPPRGPFATIIRPCARVDLATSRDAATLWLLPRAGWSRRAAPKLRRDGAAVVLGAVDPWPLLGSGATLVAHGDDEWVALARIAGMRVRLLSAGRFGTPGESEAAAMARIAAMLGAGTTYRDPFTDRAVALETTIALLGDWRRQIDANRGIAVATGFAWWKRREIARFLWAARSPPFVRSTRRALAVARRDAGAIAVWPSRVSPTLIAGAAQARVGITRVEDGFIRSVGLGSGLFPPLSVTVDPIGIHYDPAAPSALETLLATADFPPPLIARAEALIALVLAARLGKYGGAADDDQPTRTGARRLVLVPGQVEDDLSVIHGGGDVAGNLDLLRRVRAIEPAAEIWFRPHPDVDAGHRRGAIRDGDALAHADRVVRGGAMAPLLETVDALHVLTSLAGFEALLRGREVVAHGTPFYAGWGLTRDLVPPPSRRTRVLTLAELVAGALILFPRYLDPVTGLPCPVEILVARFATQMRPRRTVLTSVRALQGLFTRRLA